MIGPLTALIAEDEAPQRRELRALLAKLWPDLTIVAECADGPAAIAALAEHQPDIAFLDIRMPGASGLDVARRIGPATQLVFITAYDEFAIAAFEAGAADYLLKPIRADRLADTIARLRARHPAAQPGLAALLDTLTAQLAPRRTISWITASIGDTVRMIAIDDVLFFQSEEKYTRVATATESAHIRTSLKELLAQLDPEIFWQIHRGTIVRVAAIRQVRPDEDGHLRLWLDGVPEPLRISDAWRHRFRAM